MPNSSLANQLIIAMPSLMDFNFNRVVIYICEHHAQGTIGLIINKPMTFHLNFVFEQMKISCNSDNQNKQPLLFGGPIQPERGFVIHSLAGQWRSSLSLQPGVNLTTSEDIIRSLAANAGPKDALVTLGYTGWNQQQLEQEIIDSHWLICPYKQELLYEIPFTKRWEYAGSLIGVNMNQLTTNVGHA